ncbi:MAG TPA: YihY/virulence factor BrkB family protein [Candidatus Krumholzibacteria bacterium]|nr:YihY/virulence factor BrkB family protein [Candidatus Krumholzibacteria bacterium]HPD70585.1 YihY/virulence factor BrkB family protein [Candidatus Krumholzibacteria bacterium]HRY39715.1 YihY/virulence factor BrkB family protein [Candidatus Krumholzibacteria bacterium]
MFKRHWQRALAFLDRLRREIAYDDCMGMAAQIAYYMMLSFVPFLIFLLSIISQLPLGQDLQTQLFDAFREQMPRDAGDYVVDTVMGILPTRSREVTLASAAISLWGASMAIGAMITTINRAYNLRPRRNMLVQKLMSIALLLVLAAILLLAMVITLLGRQVTQGVFEYLQLASESNTFWTTMRLPIAALLAFGAVTILYFFAPEARQRFIHILPGSITAMVFWLLASYGFRLFVENFGSYNATYGSLAAVVILLAYFWLTGFIFLVGAEINALMKRLDAAEDQSLFRPLR